jgi:hypothetical protein
MAPRAIRQSIDSLMRDIGRGDMKSEIQSYYDWLQRLANAHFDWISLELDVLKNMKRGNEGIRCDVLEEFSERFARYLLDIRRLMDDMPSFTQFNKNLQSVLQRYINLPLGIDPRLKTPSDKFSTLWAYLGAADNHHIFEALRHFDPNCTIVDSIRILDNLENSARYLIPLLEVDSIVKSEWEARLNWILEERQRLQPQMEDSSEDIDYDEILLKLGAHVLLQELEEENKSF